MINDIASAAQGWDYTAITKNLLSALIMFNHKTKMSCGFGDTRRTDTLWGWVNRAMELATQLDVDLRELKPMARKEFITLKEFIALKKGLNKIASKIQAAYPDMPTWNSIFMGDDYEEVDGEEEEEEMIEEAPKKTKKPPSNEDAFENPD